MRVLLASLLVCVGSVACTGGGSRADTPLRTVELVLQPGGVDVHAAFPADQDPKPHIQPIAQAIATARSSCRAIPAAMLELEVHRNHLQARARTVTAECLAHALDGAPIADSDVIVQLLVNA